MKSGRSGSRAVRSNPVMATNVTKTLIRILMAATFGLGVAPPAEARRGTGARRARKARPDGLDPLYRRIARDLKAGRPLVITVHVALCSNRSIWCGSKKLGNGDKPRTNLYWGGASGLTAWFRYRRKGYKQVFRDGGDGKVVVDRVVYRRRVGWISKRWKRFGVTKPFDVYLVGLAYRGRHIGKAVDALIRQTATGAGSTLKLKTGKTIAIGGRGHLVGYAGHNYLMDTGGRWKWPKITRKRPVGYFMLACMSAQYLAPRLTHKLTHAVLLTRVFMYPGAFTIDGLIRALSFAQRQRAVFRKGCAYYARYSKVKAATVRRGMFTHDGRRKFRKRYPGKSPGKSARPRPSTP